VLCKAFSSTLDSVTLKRKIVRIFASLMVEHGIGLKNKKKEIFYKVKCKWNIMQLVKSLRIRLRVMC